jgi:hypothetical protein
MFLITDDFLDDLASFTDWRGPSEALTSWEGIMGHVLPRIESLSSESVRHSFAVTSDRCTINVLDLSDTDRPKTLFTMSLQASASDRRDRALLCVAHFLAWHKDRD